MSAGFGSFGPLDGEGPRPDARPPQDAPCASSKAIERIVKDDTIENQVRDRIRRSLGITACPAERHGESSQAARPWRHSWAHATPIPMCRPDTRIQGWKRARIGENRTVERSSGGVNPRSDARACTGPQMTAFSTFRLRQATLLPAAGHRRGGREKRAEGHGPVGDVVGYSNSEKPDTVKLVWGIEGLPAVPRPGLRSANHWTVSRTRFARTADADRW